MISNVVPVQRELFQLHIFDHMSYNAPAVKELEVATSVLLGYVIQVLLKHDSESRALRN